MRVSKTNLVVVDAVIASSYVQMQRLEYTETGESDIEKTLIKGGGKYEMSHLFEVGRSLEKRFLYTIFLLSVQTIIFHHRH